MLSFDYWNQTGIDEIVLEAWRLSSNKYYIFNWIKFKLNKYYSAMIDWYLKQYASLATKVKRKSKHLIFTSLTFQYYQVSVIWPSSNESQQASTAAASQACLNNPFSAHSFSALMDWT